MATTTTTSTTTTTTTTTVSSVTTTTTQVSTSCNPGTFTTVDCNTCVCNSNGQYVCSTLTFSGCAEWVYGGEHQGKLWCSTKVDSTGTHVNGEGNYGFCSSTCTAVSLFDLIGNLLGDGSSSTAQRRGSG